MRRMQVTRLWGLADTRLANRGKLAVVAYQKELSCGATIDTAASASNASNAPGCVRGRCHACPDPFDKLVERKREPARRGRENQNRRFSRQDRQARHGSKSEHQNLLCLAPLACFARDILASFPFALNLSKRSGTRLEKCSLRRAMEFPRERAWLRACRAGKPGNVAAAVCGEACVTCVD